MSPRLTCALLKPRSAACSGVAVFSPSPTRKRQVLEAARLTVSPVRGLRAVPAGALDRHEAAEAHQADFLAGLQRGGHRSR